MSQEDQNKPESSSTKLWVLYLALFCVLIVWACSGWILYPLEDTKRGTFGDMFGAVNSLFSGLAFAALIFTVFMQREELSLQRQELKETRNELKRSATAQEASEAALRALAEASSQSATLSATHTILTYYREAIADLGARSIQLDPSLQQKIDFLEVRQRALLAGIEQAYQRITTEHAIKQKAPSDV